MTSQQFRWNDRDTAARDLLQLVYHAPPTVSSRALNLLRSIRSESILPELETIVMDDNRDIWDRRYALRGTKSVSPPVEMPQLAPYMERAFSARCKRFRESPRPQFYNSDLSPDLLDDLFGLVEKHPSNRDWFFDVLRRVEEPTVTGDYIDHVLHYQIDDDFRRKLFGILLDLIDNHPEALALSIASRFLTSKSEKAHELLDKNLERIIKRCLGSRGPSEWLYLAFEWPELCDELVKVNLELAVQISDYKAEIAQRREQWQSREQKGAAIVRGNAIYQFLVKLYEAAQNDDYNAYDKLRQIAKWGKSIPFQAVATYFIGKLAPKYDSLTVLRYQMKYAHDDWGDESSESPTRFEAGEALSRHPSPENWESLVDAFFINPRNVLSSFIHDWIEHVTDILSGDLHDYQGTHWGTIENRRWSHALADLDEKVLERYS